MPRRAIYLALVSLLLGVITTVAIAWTIAFNRPNGSGAMGWGAGFIFENDGALYAGFEHRLRGHSFVALDGTANPGIAEMFHEAAAQLGSESRSAESIPAWVRLPSAAECTPRSRQFCSNAYGWPSLAMYGAVLEATTPNPADPTAHITVFKDYWVLGDQYYPGARTLPVGIIWPGFLINTLTFAAAWFLALLLGERIIRRIGARLALRRTLRRGTCPVCRYDLRGDFDSGCPECGWNRTTNPLTQPAAPSASL